MPRRVVPLPIPPGPACLQALPALRAALDGSGPAVAPYAGGPGAVPPALTLHGSDGLPDDLAVVVGTSGSTGTAKLAMLGADALAASAAATAERLGGPADWVLALPPQHIAGLQVLLRALAWGTQVDVLPDDPLRPEGFAAALAARRHAPGGYISLVPTQLGRLLRDERAADALAGFAAVLLGGAACPPALLEAARSAGIAVVTSYGASETCGGCVYDGEPLACAQVFLEDPDASGAGRVLLAGEMVAHGYLGDPGRTASCFPTRDGRRVFRSDDVGTWDVPTGGGAPRLAVLGRADDIIVTGGYKGRPGSSRTRSPPPCRDGTAWPSACQTPSGDRRSRSRSPPRPGRMVLVRRRACRACGPSCGGPSRRTRCPTAFASCPPYRNWASESPIWRRCVRNSPRGLDRMAGTSLRPSLRPREEESPCFGCC